jgi:cell division transport system permease protein
MRVRVVLSEAWRSLMANVSTTVAATMTVLIGMFLLGLFVALGTWTLSWSDHAKRQLMVKVYFADSAGPGQWNALVNRLNADPRVKHATFVPKAEGLKRMSSAYPDLTKNLTSNPLPNAIEIQPRRGEDVDAIYLSLTHPKPPGVNKVRDGAQVSHRILQVAHAIELVFVIAVLILLAASVLLIANTIRLSIFSRRREIEVMKLVGATNWFVRGPFILEGIGCGLLGALGAITLLLLGKEVAATAILDRLNSTSDVHALSFPLTAAIIMGAALMIGAAGSGFTIRRFLRI